MHIEDNKSSNGKIKDQGALQVLQSFLEKRVQKKLVEKDIDKVLMGCVFIIS